MSLFAITLAAIELISPAQNASVQLIPDCQRSVITNETRVQREAALAAVRKGGSKKTKDSWRKANDIVFSWRTTAKERETMEFAISKSGDFKDARIEYLRATTNNGGIVRYILPRANLEISTKYHWRVMVGNESASGSFVTEDLAPRWMEIEGRVGNFRDLGGRIGLGGRRVRQGMIYRSQGLNDNSVGGKRKGRNRLFVEDVDYLTKTLGIRTDLDLRSGGETANMTTSPMGNGVMLVHHSSSAYAGIFTDAGKKVTAENFRVFCDRNNYPILFHCIAGADRTGALGYVLNGVLGVSRRELETDWESTFYPKIPYKDKSGRVLWNSESHFDEGFGAFGDGQTSWNDRITPYLKSCGITDAEIEAFRSIMLGND